MSTKYEVTGIHPVLGHAPGSVFTATLPREQEQALLAGGALRKVAAPKTPPKRGAKD